MSPPASSAVCRPSLSVVTPSLNQLVFLRRCVQSVAAQDYPTVEQIVIDGGSSDGTREFLASRPGVVTYWQSEPDRGQSHALNLGFARASGEWVGWQNADDFYLPAAFERFAAGVARYPEAMVVVGDTALTGSTGAMNGTIGICPVPATRWLEGFWPYNQAMFFRRALLERVGALDESLRLHMDTDLLARVALLAPPVVYRIEVLGAFRKHSGGKTLAGEFDSESQRERTTLELRYGRKLWPQGPRARLVHRLQSHTLRFAAFGMAGLVQRTTQRTAMILRAEPVLR
ncbi:MAG: glycosyltransferase family 2 protein [Thermoanaerobaculaceae bacterium]